MKVAIVTDDHKLPKFREALSKAKIVVAGETPFTQKTTIMTIMIEATQLDEVRKICELQQINFNQAN